MKKSYNYFDHVQEAAKHQKNFVYKTSSDWENNILSKRRFNDFLNLEGGNSEQFVKRYYKAYNFDPVAISNELARVRC